jgi:hypothetical protein
MKTRKVKALSKEEMTKILGGIINFAPDEPGSKITDVTSEIASGDTTRDTDAPIATSLVSSSFSQG